MKVVLATFATEGPPHDEGLPIAGECLAPFVKKVLESGIDQVYAFTPRTLKQFLGDDEAKFCTRTIDIPRRFKGLGYNKSGMGTWKAAILKEVANMYDDGDIIVFHDLNWKKYPGILTGFAPLARDYAIAATKLTRIFAPPHLTLVHTVSHSVFRRLTDVNPTPFLNCPAGRCRCIIVKLDPEVRHFLSEFYDACKIDENLSGIPDAGLRRGGWPISGFIHNAAEQAVFNTLLYSRGWWKPGDQWIKDLKDIGLADDSDALKLLNYVASTVEKCSL